MISNGLLQWQQSNSFRLENNTVYGVYNGVGFAVSNDSGGKLFTFMLTGPDSAFDAIEDRLIAERGRLNEVQVGDVDNYLALFFEENSGEMPEQLMTALLGFVQANAISCGFTVPRVCVKCGAPANKRTLYKNMVQPMCAACHNEVNAGRQTQRPRPQQQPEPPAPTRGDSLMPQRSRYNPDEDDTYDQYTHDNVREQPPRSYASQSSYAAQSYSPQQDFSRGQSSVPMSFSTSDRDEGDMAKGVIGAALGAIAGLVPMMISVLLGFQLTFLCAASGVGAVFGYVGFRGLKRKNTALIWTVAMAELFSILAFLGVNVVTAMKGGSSISLALSTGIFTGVKDYLNLLITVICSALGVAVMLDKISNYIGVTISDEE